MADKSKKKILYIITKSVWGGAGKYVYDLAVNLPAEKFEAHVAAGGNGPLAEKIKEAGSPRFGEAGIPYHDIKNFQRDVNVFKEIAAYFEILFLLLKIRPDIIHVNSSKAGGIAGQAALDYKILTFNFGVKTVFTAHGWAFHEKRPKWQIYLITLLTKLTALFYNKIICVSEFDRQSAIKNRIAPAEKLITIHNGINYNECKFLSRQEARQKLNLPADILCVGAVGEFTKNKGHEYLVDAAQKLKMKNEKLKILLIGWGELKESLKLKIKNEKLENHIFLIDNLSPASPYFKAFDIFVLPSLKEGLPYTLLEAGLAELPVIASATGGIPEIIEDPSTSSGQATGLLIEPSNSDNIKNAIEELVKNPELERSLANNLHRKIMSEFNFEKMLNSTLAAYEENAKA